MTATLASLPQVDVTNGVRPGQYRNPHAKMIEIAWMAACAPWPPRLAGFAVRVTFRDLEQVEAQLGIGMMNFIISPRDLRRFAPVLQAALPADLLPERLATFMTNLAAEVEAIGEGGKL